MGMTRYQWVQDLNQNEFFIVLQIHLHIFLGTEQLCDVRGLSFGRTYVAGRSAKIQCKRPLDVRFKRLVDVDQKNPVNARYDRLPVIPLGMVGMSGGWVIIAVKVWCRNETVSCSFWLRYLITLSTINNWIN